MNGYPYMLKIRILRFWRYFLSGVLPSRWTLLFFRYDEFAISRLSDHFAFLHDHFPSNDRVGDFPLKLPSVIGVQLILHKNLVGTDCPLSVHIADTEIGIRPGNVRALAGIETKDPGPVD